MDYKVEHAKTIFETVTPYKVVSIKRFNAKNFKDNKFYIINNLNERYILTKYSDKLNENLINQDYLLTLEMQGLKYIPDCLYYDKKERVKITERIYATSDLNFLTKTELKILATSLKGFHKLKHKATLKPYNPFEVIDECRSYLSEHILPLNQEKYIINRAMFYYQKNEKFICHNFLLKENFIINKKNTYFFNYDYMGCNDPLYDIAMMFVSLNITNNEDIAYFLNSYYGNQYNDEMIDAFNAYTKLVKLVLIYKLRRINKEYDSHEFNDILTRLILELKNII